MRPPLERPLDQHPGGVAHIAGDLVDDRAGPGAADRFFQRLDAPQLQRRLAARGDRRHPRVPLFVDQQIECALNLVVEIPFDLPAAEEVAEQARKACEDRHVVLLQDSSAHVMASATRLHSCFSWASCRRPALVSR